MSEPGVSLGLVIPTRNRARLAIAACESLLPQRGCAFHVFVSDNSTDPEESRPLAEYCSRAGAGRLTYLKPPVPLAMSTHWDWALRTAMSRGDATHFNVHYDRRITKPDHLSLVARVMAAHPDQLITWTNDVIGDEPGSSIVWQTPWDGLLRRIPTSLVVAMTIEGRITDMGQAFPILSNCAVPREVLAALIDRFGNICDSTAPDSAFAYRFCAARDSYLHFDRAVGIVYAFERSTGNGFMRGRGGDFADFMQWWGDRPWLDAAPIPGLNLGQNVLFHEYEVVRRAVDHAAFRPVRMQGYLSELATSLRRVEDPARRAELRAVLVQHGWNTWSDENESVPYNRGLSVRDGWPWLRRRLIQTMDATADVMLGDRHKARRARTALRKFAVHRLGLRPAHICGFDYPTDAEAVREALAIPRRRSSRNPLLAWLRDAEIIPIVSDPPTLLS